MVQRNEHTGDKLQTDVPSEAYRIGWDNIFNKKKRETVDEYVERIVDEELIQQLQKEDFV